MRIQLTCVCVAALALSSFGQNMTDQEFVNKAAQIHMTEAHLGGLAQQKSQTPKVKEYGQKLESDHKAGYQRLTSLNAGYNVPNAIDAEHNTIIQRFSNHSGEDFDRQFREMMVEDHQKAIDLFQQAQNRANNAALRDYAAQQLPMLRDHLDRAKDLGGNVTSQRTTPSTTGQSLNQPNDETRARMADTPGMTSDNSRTEYGTVTRYEAGKSLELKIRDRIGRHVYDIPEGQRDVQLPSDLRVGSQVVITESIDKNGQRSVNIRNDTDAGRAAGAHTSR